MQIAISSHTSSRNFILIAGLLLYCGAFAILLGNKSFDADWRSRCAHCFWNRIAAHRMDYNSPCYSALDFYSVGSARIDRANRICGRRVALPDRRPAVDRPTSTEEHGLSLSRLNSSLPWRKSCSFSLLFRLRSFDSVSVIEFAILGFSAKVCARCAEIIYWLFSL